VNDLIKQFLFTAKEEPNVKIEPVAGSSKG